MPVSCCAVGCTRRFKNGENTKIFRFPDEKKYPEQRKSWIIALHRVSTDGKTWIPSEHDRICSKHFFSGFYSRDPNHVDYKPSIFGFSETSSHVKRKLACDRYERRNKRLFISSKINSSEQQQQSNDPCSFVDSEVVSPEIQLSAVDKELNLLREKCFKLEQEKENELQQIRDEHENKIAVLNKNVSFLTTQTNKLRWGVHHIKTNKNCKYYTGLPSYATFDWVYQTIKPYMQIVKQIHTQNQLLMVLMRLRKGFELRDLAHRFQISLSTVGRIFKSVLNVLYSCLQCLISWPEQILRIPKSFKNSLKYKKTKVIIDCFEIFIQRPSNLKLRALTWSNYKHHNTAKFLVGIAPSGIITFLSQAYGGRISDKKITQKSGFFKKLSYDDLVLADRGFLIAEDLALFGATLAIPKFTRGKKQLAGKDVEATRHLANVRIHVERAIGRLKEFQIFQRTFRINTLEDIDKIITVCAAIVNLQPKLVS